MSTDITSDGIKLFKILFTTWIINYMIYCTTFCIKLQIITSYAMIHPTQIYCNPLKTSQLPSIIHSVSTYTSISDQCSKLLSRKIKISYWWISSKFMKVLIWMLWCKCSCLLYQPRLWSLRSYIFKRVLQKQNIKQKRLTSATVKRLVSNDQIMYSFIFN